jgi:hypothetical protein
MMRRGYFLAVHHTRRAEKSEARSPVPRQIQQVLHSRYFAVRSPRTFRREFCPSGKAWQHRSSRSTSGRPKVREKWNAGEIVLIRICTDCCAENSPYLRNNMNTRKNNIVDRNVNTSTIVSLDHTKEYLQPRFVRRLTDAGDPIFGANSFWIGHFQARARQLTS